MSEITFFVPGIPKPGGSKKAFFIQKLGRSVIVDASKNKEWRTAVAWFAKAESDLGAELLRCPLEVEFHFVMPRPLAHFRAGKNAGVLRPNAPTYHTHAPDTTKLIRSTEDALTGVLWADDALIVEQIASKKYGEQPGCRIVVRRLAFSEACPPAADMQPTLL